MKSRCRALVFYLVESKTVDCNSGKKNIRGFQDICSRRQPSRPSMGREDLGLAKIIRPNTGECQGQEAGVGGLGSWAQVQLNALGFDLE